MQYFLLKLIFLALIFDALSQEINVLSEPKTSAGCEGEILNLYCDYGKYILVRGAQLQINGNKCLRRGPKNFCPKDLYISKVRELAVKCRNTEECFIPIADRTFGSNCRGDIRFMNVTYFCSMFEIDENNQVKIPIEDYTTKKKTTKRATTTARVSSTTARASTTTARVSSTTARASSTTTRTTTSTKKTQFTTIPIDQILSPPKSFGGCENDTLDLTCPKNQFIYIKKAVLFVNSDRCSLKRQNTVCSNSTYINITNRVCAECKNKETCKVPLNHQTFGKECDFDVRYLNLTYICSIYEIDEQNRVKIPDPSESQQTKKPLVNVISEPKSIARCEGQKINLNCNELGFIIFKKINILINSDKCSKKNPKTVCSSDFYDKVAFDLNAKCMNTRECEIGVNNQKFGCNGDIRFLNLTYVCSRYKLDSQNQIIDELRNQENITINRIEDDDSENILTEEITKNECENAKVNMTCKDDRYVLIRGIEISVNSNKCTKKLVKPKCSIMNYNSVSKNLAKHCTNKKSCEFKVNNDIFGKQCNGDIRHVSVVYTCSLFEVDENSNFILPGSRDFLLARNNIFGKLMGMKNEENNENQHYDYEEDVKRSYYDY